MEKVKSFLKEGWPFLLLATIGLCFKLYGLGDRPLHHDESLHAQYGKYFANSFSKGFYKYDPLLHGPLLYHLQGFWTWLAGPLDKFSLRIIPVVIGFVLSLTPLLFLKRVNRTTLLFIASFLALSPTFTFWSRFLRHDFLVLGSLFAIGYLWIKRPKYYSLYIGAACGLHFSTKENFFVHIAIVLGFLVTEAFVNKKIRTPGKHECWQFALGFFVVSVPLYTAWFQYWDGILDGLYRKSIGYWLEQHHVERIKGPFFFNSLIMSIYEPWLIPIVTLLAYYWLRSMNLMWRCLDITAALVFLLCAAVAFDPPSNFLLTWFKTKNSIDLFVFLISIYVSLRVTITLLKQQKTALAFWSYLAFSSFFTYSYLGEKVPWLAIYPTLCFMIFVATFLPKITHRMQVLTFVLLIACIPKTIYINHRAGGDAKELISQVHTTKAYEDVALKLKESLELPPGFVKPRILVLEDNGWPLSWYIWGLSGVEYRKMANYHDYDFIYDKLMNPALATELVKTHERQVIPLRHYWWPSFSDITFRRWVKLIFEHEVWSDTGEYNIALWRKREGFFSE